MRAAPRPDPRQALLRLRLVRCAAMAIGLLLAGCGAGATARPTPAPSAGSTAMLSGLLRQAWDGYKQTFIQPDGRVIDPTRGDLTTSEGQSYALLRAVWMNDATTFGTVWHWTAANLQVRGDGLLAESWGSGAVKDTNSASDADSDAALALFFAARRFGVAAYRADGRQMLTGIWEHDVTSVDGMQALTAGNWAAVQRAPGLVLNPSYFAPYAYRIFAREDTAHPWLAIVDSAYVLLARCTAATLDGIPSAGLPPNWCAIDRSTGAVVSFPEISDANDYGYDAFRVMWRIALDAIWNDEPRARDYLVAAAFLRGQWNREHRPRAVYGHDGSVVGGYDDLTLYGGDIGNFVVAAPSIAGQVQAALVSLFRAGPPAAFGNPKDYFEQNWVWFGIALGGGQLPNLDRAP